MHEKTTRAPSWTSKALAALALATAFLAAADAPRQERELSPPDRAAVEGIVRDYLLQHPEVIIEALRKLEEQDRAAQAAHVREVVAAEKAALFKDGRSFVAGSSQGDVTIVEFYDYNCAFCRKVAPDVRTLLKRDKNLRLVFKEWPIRGEDSEAAARVSIAAARQARFSDFHFALMGSEERATERLALEVARKAGLDMERLKADMQAIDMDSVLASNRVLADKLGLEGTPAFLVGDTLIPGVAPLSDFTALIAQKRNES